MPFHIITRRGEQAAVLLVILGVLGMVQPFTLYLVSYGFVVTLIGTLLFIVVSHL